MTPRLGLALLLPLLGACASLPSAGELAQRREEVFATERSFAASMARRDHAAFVAHLADDTVFFSGPKPLHGKAAVAEFWARLYREPQAPFSWEPAEVELLDAGDLALSTGPVHDPAGRTVASFTSIWRREAPGVWKIIFDKGCDVCAACPATPPPAQGPSP